MINLTDSVSKNEVADLEAYSFENKNDWTILRGNYATF